MNWLKRIAIWILRAHHSRGFGIQSPTDYWLVRYVINEHWPYYAYSELGLHDNWLRRKTGQLYMRIANWRQPQVIVTNDYQDYWQAGCRRAAIIPEQNGERIEILHTDISHTDGLLDDICHLTDNQSVVIIEGIWRDSERWQRLVADQRTVVTFDLYYCGILLFDRQRTKQHYIINF